MLFKDSLAFMGKGLDDLVKTLEPEQLKLTRRYIEEYVSKNKTTMPNLGLYNESNDTTEDKERNEVFHASNSMDAICSPPPAKKQKESEFLDSMAECKDDADDEDCDELDISSSFIDDDPVNDDINSRSMYHRFDNSIVGKRK